jgi:hypothetical protein
MEKTNRWRSIIEMSCMQNNDEFVIYTDIELTNEVAIKHFKRNYFDSPTLVISRPVFCIEVNKGLDTTFVVEARDKVNDPQITKFIDACFKINKNVNFYKEFWENFDATKFIAHHIAYSFYDCMSGGMPMCEIAICRELIKNIRVDKEVIVYPTFDKDHFKKTGRDYYNLQDFLKETENTEIHINEEIKQLIGHLSLPALTDGKN